MSRIHLMTGLWLLGLIAAYQLGKLTRTEVVSVGVSLVPES